jgi:hypothetical protein
VRTCEFGQVQRSPLVLLAVSAGRLCARHPVILGPVDAPLASPVHSAASGTRFPVRRRACLIIRIDRLPARAVIASHQWACRSCPPSGLHPVRSRGREPVLPTELEQVQLGARLWCHVVDERPQGTEGLLHWDGQLAVHVDPNPGLAVQAPGSRCLLRFTTSLPVVLRIMWNPSVEPVSRRAVRSIRSNLTSRWASSDRSHPPCKLVCTNLVNGLDQSVHPTYKVSHLVDPPTRRGVRSP